MLSDSDGPKWPAPTKRKRVMREGADEWDSDGPKCPPLPGEKVDGVGG